MEKQLINHSTRTLSGDKIIKLTSMATDAMHASSDNEHLGVLVSRQQIIDDFVMGDRLNEGDTVIIDGHDVFKHQQRPDVGNNKLFTLAEMDRKLEISHFMLEVIMNEDLSIAAD